MHAALDLARRTAEGFLMFVARPQSTLCMSRDVKHKAFSNDALCLASPPSPGPVSTTT